LALKGGKKAKQQGRSIRHFPIGATNARGARVHVFRISRPAIHNQGKEEPGSPGDHTGAHIRKKKKK